MRFQLYNTILTLTNKILFNEDPELLCDTSFKVHGAIRSELYLQP